MAIAIAIPDLITIKNKTMSKQNTQFQKKESAKIVKKLNAQIPHSKFEVFDDPSVQLHGRDKEPGIRFRMQTMIKSRRPFQIDIPVVGTGFPDNPYVVGFPGLVLDEKFQSEFKLEAETIVDAIEIIHKNIKRLNQLNLAQEERENKKQTEDTSKTDGGNLFLHSKEY